MIRFVRAAIRTWRVVNLASAGKRYDAAELLIIWRAKETEKETDFEGFTEEDKALMTQAAFRLLCDYLEKHEDRAIALADQKFMRWTPLMAIRSTIISENEKLVTAHGDSIDQKKYSDFELDYQRYLEISMNKRYSIEETLSSIGELKRSYPDEQEYSDFLEILKEDPYFKRAQSERKNQMLFDPDFYGELRKVEGLLVEAEFPEGVLVSDQRIP